MLSEAVMASFHVLSLYLPGGTEENNKQSEAGQQLSGARYESRPSKMKTGVDQTQLGSQGYPYLWVM
jgi:hypothetical protein